LTDHHDKVRTPLVVSMIAVLLTLSQPRSVVAGTQTTAEVEQLIQQLQSDNDAASFDAARALAKLKAPSSVEPLIKALAHRAPRVRWRAASVLGAIKDSRSVIPLLATLKDTDELVRSHTAGALGQIKDPRAIGPLLESLKDTDARVRWNAAQGLGDIGGPSIPSLLKALKDQNPNVRRWAAFALGEIKHPQAVAALEGALADRNLETIAGAYQYFIRKGKPGTEAVLIASFQKYGIEEMAFAFILSENKQLNKVGSAWQRQNTKGDTLITGPPSPHPTWGSGRK